MPLYGSQAMQGLYPGESVNLFNGEAPAAGQSSIAIFIAPKDVDQPGSISLELLFSGAPGAFEFDVQVADTDTPDAYIVVPAVGQITTAQAGLVKSVARLELSPILGRFVRLLCVTPITTGGVTVIAKISN